MTESRKRRDKLAALNLAAHYDIRRDSAHGNSLKWGSRGNDSPRNVAPVFAECRLIRLCGITLHNAFLE